MTTRILFQLFVVVAGLWVQVALDFVSDEENLRNALFASYTKTVRPQNSTGVSVFLLPLSLNKLDIGEQLMSMNCIVGVAWFDQRTIWDPKLYGGIEALPVDTDTIWTPTIVVENAVENVGVMGGKSKDGTPVRVDYQGIVFWYPPMEASTSCEMRIAYFPFDTQECYITLTGWANTETEVNLTASNTDLVYYSPNGEWELQNKWSEIGYFTDGTQFFKRLNFFFSFRRKWQFYGQNLVMPIVLTSILMSAVFALPIESGEKMGFSLTVLLSYVVFLTWVTDNLPAVSTDVSILQVYLAVVLCLGVLATLLTTWVLHIYHKCQSVPMSPSLRFFVYKILVPLNRRTCCTRKNKVDSDGSTAPMDLPLSGKGNNYDKKPSKDERQTVSRESDDERDEITWPEVAVMADRFFLIVFGVIMPTLTATIIGLLYSHYYS